MLGGAALTLAAEPPARSPWPANAREYRVHMMGTSHIDTVWLWPASEARAMVLSTFRSALDRMKETPGLTFTNSSSIFFEWVEQSDPGMLAEIRARVREG